MTEVLKITGIFLLVFFLYSFYNSCQQREQRSELLTLLEKQNETYISEIKKHNTLISALQDSLAKKKFELTKIENYYYEIKPDTSYTTFNSADSSVRYWLDKLTGQTFYLDLTGAKKGYGSSFPVIHSE